MSALRALSATEIRRKVAAREVSAEEVAQAHVASLVTVEPRIEAYLLVLEERALAKARTVDRAIRRGRPAPGLAGVPVAIKDVLDVEGLPTTCGSRILEGYRPPFTATAVARLEAAGAVVIGKTNMDEFAVGSATERSAYKKPRNPWDLSRVPGGSSGGSAAAVAAGTAPMALGSDTGGSIRQPAAFCGIVGLKPTYGRVSRYGLVAFASSLDQIGPLARSVEDIALLASVLCGHDRLDSTSASLPVPDFSAALTAGARGARIGVPWGFLKEGGGGGEVAPFPEAPGGAGKAGARPVAGGV